MPAAILAGGASRRMGRSKARLPWGAGNLLEFQTERLSKLFSQVFVVLKTPPDYAIGPAAVLLDRSPEVAAIHGLLRVLEEVEDRAFVMAVDLPALPADVMREIARRGLRTEALALVPEADGRLQPLAAVWRRAVAPTAADRIARGELSLAGLAREAGAEVLNEREWRMIDPSGNSFVNLNTLTDYVANRERA